MRWSLCLLGEDRQWHRQSLVGEMPVFVLRPFGDRGYTRQAYRIRRFLSQKVWQGACS